MPIPETPPALSYQQALRYSRQILLPGFDLTRQEQLGVSNVLQIGVGGLGCAAAQYLVSSGVGQLTLVDDDHVELSNLPRQILHGEADIGRSKCQSAVDSLRQLNSTCRLTVKEQRLVSDALVEAVANHDLVLDCSDNLATRNALNLACWQTATPLVSGAAIRMEGQITCVQPAAHAPCYQCLSSQFNEPQLSCAEAGVISPVVGIIGAMQALEAIKLLTQFSTPLSGQLMLFDAAINHWQRFQINKNAACPVCQQPPGQVSSHIYTRRQ